MKTYGGSREREVLERRGKSCALGGEGPTRKLALVGEEGEQRGLSGKQWEGLSRT